MQALRSSTWLLERRLGLSRLHRQALGSPWWWYLWSWIKSYPSPRHLCERKLESVLIASMWSMQTKAKTTTEAISKASLTAKEKDRQMEVNLKVACKACLAAMTTWSIVSSEAASLCKSMLRIGTRSMSYCHRLSRCQTSSCCRRWVKWQDWMKMHCWLKSRKTLEWIKTRFWLKCGNMRNSTHEIYGFLGLYVLL